jgi:hypothetical protein
VKKAYEYEFPQLPDDHRERNILYHAQNLSFKILDLVIKYAGNRSLRKIKYDQQHSNAKISLNMSRHGIFYRSDFSMVSDFNINNYSQIQPETLVQSIPFIDVDEQGKILDIMRRFDQFNRHNGRPGRLVIFSIAKGKTPI